MTPTGFLIAGLLVIGLLLMGWAAAHPPAPRMEIQWHHEHCTYAMMRTQGAMCERFYRDA